jgi:hypothetical protein
MDCAAHRKDRTEHPPLELCSALDMECSQMVARPWSTYPSQRCPTHLRDRGHRHLILVTSASIQTIQSSPSPHVRRALFYPSRPLLLFRICSFPAEKEGDDPYQISRR